VKRGVLFALLFCPMVAGADPITLSFTPPTQRVDGSALPVAQIKNFKLYCNGNTTAKATAIKTATTFGPLSFVTGTHQCFATTVDTSNQESGPSNTVQFSVVSALPTPPDLRQD